MEKQTEISVTANILGIDDMIAKAEQLKSLLKEAKTLADELASVEFEIDYE
ncbi:hypothetical protein ACWOAH_10300 [Vagococcus vulneris]|uniref:hypothetical protein n=1 Tax=Vagococcus vulneris TaxID=1977869 RepID=UPI0014037FEF|nr:hypothetical protein [Vagococcus vulneris]